MEQFLKSFVSSTGRLTRMEYFIRSTLLTVMVIGLTTIFFSLYLPITVLACFVSYRIVQQRLRDIGVPTTPVVVVTAVVLSFIPIVSLLVGASLLFSPSNSYKGTS